MSKNKIIVDKEVIWMIIVYVIGLTVVFNLWRNSLLTGLLIALLWLINIKYWHTKNDNTLFLVGFLAGSLGEINAVQLGIWSYTNPSFFGIPLWLPLLWGETAVVLKRFADIIIQLYP